MFDIRTGSIRGPEPRSAGAEAQAATRNGTKRRDNLMRRLPKADPQTVRTRFSFPSPLPARFLDGLEECALAGRAAIAAVARGHWITGGLPAAHKVAAELGHIDHGFRRRQFSRRCLR